MVFFPTLMDGTLNRYTRHAAEELFTGTKNVLQVWYSHDKTFAASPNEKLEAQRNFAAKRHDVDQDPPVFDIVDQIIDEQQKLLDPHFLSAPLEARPEVPEDLMISTQLATTEDKKKDEGQDEFRLPTVFTDEETTPW